MAAIRIRPRALRCAGAAMAVVMVSGCSAVLDEINKQQGAVSQFLNFVGLNDAAKEAIGNSDILKILESVGADPPCNLVTAALLAGQIMVESDAGRNAVKSSAGALGIAQFLPGTWATYGVDGDGDGDKDINDPKDAIPAMAKYDCAVADMVKNVPGDKINNMLSAYNTGPGNVLSHNGPPSYTHKYYTDIRNYAEKFAKEVVRLGQEAVASSFGLEIVRQARTQIGKPYIWGGGNSQGPTGGGFDCSGLVMFAVYQARVTFKVKPLKSLPHYTGDQIQAAGPTVTLANVAPGDLIYLWLKVSANADPNHVAIYAGVDKDGRPMIIEAPRPGKPVREVPFDQYQRGEWKANRIVIKRPS